MNHVASCTEPLELIECYFAGQLDAAGESHFWQAIASDEAFARRVTAYSMMESQLVERGHCGGVSQPEPVAVRPNSSRYAFGAAAVAVAALLAIAVTVWTFTSTQSAPPQTIPSQTPREVAVLTDTENAVFADSSTPMNLGSALQAGPIKLASGRAQVMFHSGATVDLVGPCAFEMIGENQGRLIRGKLEAYVRPEAIGFTVHTPDGGRVIDLGTRFEVDVDSVGGTSVYVHEGRVAVAWGGRREVLEVGAAVRVRGGQWVVARRMDDGMKIVENFDDAAAGGLHPALEDTGGVYTYAEGRAANSARRHFIRTRATDFNTLDFVAELTYRMPDNPTGPNIAFFGIGGGEPDVTEWYNPIPGLYLETMPLRIESDRGINSDDAVLYPLGAPGAGVHRVRISKVGDAVTFAVDADHRGGDFEADRSQTLSLSAMAPFLNAENSRVFFGTEHTTTPTTFDDLSVTIMRRSVPDPTNHSQEN